MIGIKKGKYCEHESDNTDCCDDCEHSCDDYSDCDIYMDYNSCERTPKGYLICIDFDNHVFSFSYCLPHIIEARHNFPKTVWKEVDVVIWK